MKNIPWRKGFSVIVAILVPAILLAAVAGGFFIYKKFFSGPRFDKDFKITPAGEWNPPATGK